MPPEAWFPRSMPCRGCKAARSMKGMWPRHRGKSAWPPKVVMCLTSHSHFSLSSSCWVPSPGSTAVQCSSLIYFAEGIYNQRAPAKRKGFSFFFFFLSSLISQHRWCLISSQAAVSCLFLPLAFLYCDAVLETWGGCTVERHYNLQNCIFLQFGVMCSLLDTDTSFRPLFLSLLPSLLLLRRPHDPGPPQACCSQ